MEFQVRTIFALLRTCLWIKEDCKNDKNQPVELVLTLR